MFQTPHPVDIFDGEQQVRCEKCGDTVSILGEIRVFQTITTEESDLLRRSKASLPWIMEERKKRLSAEKEYKERLKSREHLGEVRKILSHTLGSHIRAIK